jgi:hypothetical protein
MTEVFWARTFEFRGSIIPTYESQHPVNVLAAVRLISLVIKYTNYILIIKLGCSYQYFSLKHGIKIA